MKMGFERKPYGLWCRLHEWLPYISTHV